jgi:hypothetical protein
MRFITIVELSRRTPGRLASRSSRRAWIASLATAYRTARPSGVSAGTWLLILGELSCWTIFGVHESDPRLIILGSTGLTATILMLLRLRRASRLHAPLAARQA